METKTFSFIYGITVPMPAILVLKKDSSTFPRTEWVPLEIAIQDPDVVRKLGIRSETDFEGLSEVLHNILYEYYQNFLPKGNIEPRIISSKYSLGKSPTLRNIGDITTASIELRITDLEPQIPQMLDPSHIIDLLGNLGAKSELEIKYRKPINLGKFESLLRDTPELVELIDTMVKENISKMYNASNIPSITEMELDEEIEIYKVGEEGEYNPDTDIFLRIDYNR